MDNLTNPLPSFDARVWAKAFIEHDKVYGISQSEETMVTWFANALMRGYDEFGNIDWVKRVEKVRNVLLECQP